MLKSHRSWKSLLRHMAVVASNSLSVALTRSGLTPRQSSTLTTFTRVNFTMSNGSATQSLLASCDQKLNTPWEKTIVMKPSSSILESAKELLLSKESAFTSSWERSNLKRLLLRLSKALKDRDTCLSARLKAWKAFGKSLHRKPSNSTWSKRSFTSGTTAWVSRRSQMRSSKPSIVNNLLTNLAA